MLITAGGVQALPAADPPPKPVPEGKSWQIPDPVPGGFASWADLMKMQSRLDAAAAEIEKAAASAPDGLAGIVAAPEKRELIVYWQGAVPAGVQSVISSQDDTVPVRVEPAKYSLKQLSSEADRLSKTPAFGEVAPRVDGSGIEVRWAKDTTAAQKSAADATLKTARVDVRVNTTAGDTAPEPLNGFCGPNGDYGGPSICRLDDAAPYYGGSRGMGCTNGFAIAWGGYTRMLTAGHCYNNGDEVRDPGSDFMGWAFNDMPTRDIMMVDARSFGRMWDGPYDTTDSTKPVAGASRSYVGNWICTSGARSGSRCNIQVWGTGIYISTALGRWGPVVKADHAEQQNAAGKGDSGGPVYSLTGDGSAVIAKGTIVAGDYYAEAPCTGVPTGVDGRFCSWRFYYADIAESLNYYGASIVTAPAG
ncbi:hypothetical protein [Streptomyces sp. NPDC051909]|uniref:hypothetical protein n=1 Tax=Streptomyces sp. NPDC051909 TaxID=3154944 RepID=UPI003414959B